MANIQPEIDDFQNAVYGEEVRGSMISLAEKINTEVEAGTTNINNQTTIITAKVQEADDALSQTDAAADAANAAASAADASRTAIEANEAARQTAETQRQTAETQRSNAEQARANAEAQRTASENDRISAEQQRVAAEHVREAAEQQRGSNEADRVAAEQQRQANEATRVSNEAERVGAESNRQANEAVRQANETERVNNETERQRAFNNMSQQILPPATRTTLGGVIVGEGLTVDADGKVDVTGGGDLETKTHAEATYAKITDLAGKANVSHTHAASDMTSGTLPVVRGGTGLDASPSMLTNLGSTTADTVLKASPRPGVTGTLPVANGGTGVTANPSMLTNLASTSADTVLKASPRPGVTGKLPIANGGTNATTAAGAVENIVDGQALKPASVSATGEVTGKKGTTTHTLSDKAESGGASNTLYDAEQAIAELAADVGTVPTGETVQGQIDDIRDSVSHLERGVYVSPGGTVALLNTVSSTNVKYRLQLWGEGRVTLYRQAPGETEWTTIKTFN